MDADGHIEVRPRRSKRPVIKRSEAFGAIGYPYDLKRSVTRRLCAPMALVSSPLLACSCAYPYQSDSVRLADAIFRGKVLSIRHLGSVARANSRAEKTELARPRVDDLQEVSFLIDAVWKGLVARRVKVNVTSRPSMCDGYEFTVGSEYVIYIAQKVRTAWDDQLGRLRSRLGPIIDPASTVATFEIGTVHCV